MITKSKGLEKELWTIEAAGQKAMILPEVRRAFGGQLVLIADGGIADGFDAFKALALGADAVCVGRPLMQPLEEDGPEGMAGVLRGMTDELKAVMVRTGAAALAEIDPAVLHFMGGAR